MIPWRVTVHCSDTKNRVRVPASEIRQWHLDRGWNDIGYHMVIQPDGEVERGRSLNVQGAHVRGQNGGNIGICLVGRDKFTDEQLWALRYKLDSICMMYDIKPNMIFCHYQFNRKKTCPGIGINDLLTWYITKDDDILNRYVLEPV